LEFETLKDEEVPCFTMSGNDYPVTQHCNPEKQNPKGQFNSHTINTTSSSYH